MPQTAWPGGGLTSIDTGYFTGSFTYGPTLATASAIQTISIGTGPDANGISWMWESITGWDSPDVSGQVVQQAADHGGWPVSQYYAPRVMTIVIGANAPNQTQRDLARALLQQIIPINDLCVMVYNEPVPKYVQLRRSGLVTETCPNLTDVDFSIIVTAPDPRKYNAVQKVLSTATLVNEPFFNIGLKAQSQALNSNPTFAGGSLTGWNGNNGATLSTTGSPPAGGANTPYALVMAPNGTTANPLAIESAALFPVQQGDVINVTAQAQAVVTTSAFVIGLTYYNAASTSVSAATTTVTVTAANTWQGIASGNLTVPFGTGITQAAVQLGLAGTPAATDHLTVENLQALGPSYSGIGLASGSNNVFLPAGMTPGSVRAWNQGTFESRPLIRIQGPAHGPKVVNQATGQTVGYSQVVLGRGDILLIDFYRRVATLNGNYVPADIQSSWWTIWPGVQTIALLGAATDAGAMMTVYFRDAWI